jgi:hypothetical protein
MVGKKIIREIKRGGSIVLSFCKTYYRKWAGIIVLLFCSLTGRAQEDELKNIIDSISSVNAPDEYNDDKEPGKRYFVTATDTLSVRVRNLPADAVRRMKEDDAFWYADKDLSPEQKLQQKKTQTGVAPEKENGEKTQKGKNEPAIKEETVETRSDREPSERKGGWFSTLLFFVIVGVFLAGLIMYLSNSNIGLFRKKDRKTATIQEEELITEDIFAINYQKDIDKAAGQGNFRLAIRLMFLRTLKNMSERNIIRYKQDKTNLDYLLELHPTKYYNDFFRVTRDYEYSWYGQFPLSEEAYKLVRQDFDRFDKELR